MKKLIGLLLVLILLVTITGCQTDNKTEQITIASMFPLQEGNYWTYKGHGNEFADMQRKVLYVEESRVQMIESNPGTTMAVIYEIRDGELAVIYSEPDFYDETNLTSVEPLMNQIILKEPVIVGQSWENDIAVYTINSITEEVQTEAGLFSDCVMIEVKFKGSTGLSFSYYKPGLGMVLQEYIDTEIDYVVSSELSDYNVAGFEK